ncbi:hypothetical protein [uncultured Methanobrevibacter sp.]|uniref:hypothetical protein n=1 Tax=uncultured Methanobrevibacter sp. TaxID=253161 RepID=UPI0026053EFD|nr:hypothetical protein [uncultured Methanobrevibacter sp.]
MKRWNEIKNNVQNKPKILKIIYVLTLIAFILIICRYCGLQFLTNVNLDLIFVLLLIILLVGDVCSEI